MISATELRLGNYVNNSNGFPMYVTAIFEDSVYLNFEGNEGDIWEEKCEDIFPIMSENVFCGFPCNSFHKWQNLYFAINGIEWEGKP